MENQQRRSGSSNIQETFMVNSDTNLSLSHQVTDKDMGMGTGSDPPFCEKYTTLFQKEDNIVLTVEECEVPLIDLALLSMDESSSSSCKKEIARASKEWGFFQVINHGISKELLDKMRQEQVKVFKKPFEVKNNNLLPSGCYRWGTPTATCLRQFSWSEAFHFPATAAFDTSSSLSSTIEQFATTVAALAQKLAEILAEQLGHKSTFFQEHCLPSTCYLRMNRYPPCTIPVEVFGLMPHTDSDFLTILHQDQVGGLQLIKDGKWIAVKPNPEALIINIGDLFQAWSNDVYKSVEHRVMTNPNKERFSTAYFFCPSYNTVIQNGDGSSHYKQFSFGEFRQKVQEDVQKFGHKVGLPRFLLRTH